MTHATTAGTGKKDKSRAKEKSKSFLGGLHAPEIDMPVLTVNGYRKKASNHLHAMLGTWRHEDNRHEETKVFRQKLVDSMKGDNRKTGTYKAAELWDTTYKIQKDNAAERNFLDDSEKFFATMAGIELMTQTQEGALALDAAKLGFSEVRKIYDDVRIEYSRVFGIWDKKYHALWQEVSLNKDSLEAAADDLVVEVLSLKDLYERSEVQMIAAFNKANGGLNKALDWESVKAWVRAHPEKSEETLEKVEKAVGEANSLVDSHKEKLSVSGTTKEIIGLGCALVESLSLRVFRQLKSAVVSNRVDEIMKDPAKKTETLKALSVEPLAAANYLKGKYEATLDQILADFNLGVTAVKTAVFAAVGAATHGASEQITALIGSILEAIVSILRKAIKTFLMTIQELRIEAAEEELKKKEGQKGLSENEAKRIAQKESTESQSALEQILSNAEAFAEGVLEKVTGSQKDSLGATIEKFMKGAAKAKEFIDYMKKILGIDKLESVDIPGIVQFFVTPVITECIKEALKKVQIKPAQIYSYETYEAAILSMPVHK